MTTRIGSQRRTYWWHKHEHERSSDHRCDTDDGTDSLSHSNDSGSDPSMSDTEQIIRNRTVFVVSIIAVFVGYTLTKRVLKPLTPDYLMWYWNPCHMCLPWDLAGFVMFCVLLAGLLTRFYYYVTES